MVCVTRAPVCAGCLLQRTCAYSYLFETPPAIVNGKMRRYTAAPHPYVLDTGACDGRSFEPGETVDLGLTLIGHANRQLPYLVQALLQIGTLGIGRARARLQLTDVAQHRLGEWGEDGVVRIYPRDGVLAPLPSSSPPIPPVPEGISISIFTPLRLKRAGRLVAPEQFQFADFFGNLLRRISMLTYFHTDTPLETDFAGLMAAARGVPMTSVDLGWRDWTRYSSRQRTTMEMGGLVGRFRIEGVDLAPFWPYLWLGQWVHAGKAAVMGNGRYRIEYAASLPPQTAAPP